LFQWELWGIISSVRKGEIGQLAQGNLQDARGIAVAYVWLSDLIRLQWLLHS